MATKPNTRAAELLLWALCHGAKCDANDIVWRGVRYHDLPTDADGIPLPPASLLRDIEESRTKWRAGR